MGQRMLVHIQEILADPRKEHLLRARLDLLFLAIQGLLGIYKIIRPKVLQVHINKTNTLQQDKDTGKLMLTNLHKLDKHLIRGSHLQQLDSHSIESHLDSDLTLTITEMEAIITEPFQIALFRIVRIQ